MLVHRPEKIQGRAAKLGLPWTGPFTITQVINPQNLLLVPVEDPRVLPFRVHTRRVKPFVVHAVNDADMSNSDFRNEDTIPVVEVDWTDQPLEPVPLPEPRYFLRSRRSPKD